MKEQSPRASVLTAVAPGENGVVYVVGFEGAVLKRSGSAATVATAHRSPESVAVSPNPFRSSTRLLLGNDTLKGAWQPTLRDVVGRSVRMIAREGEPSMGIERGGLAAGICFYMRTVDETVQATGTMTAY